MFDRLRSLLSSAGIPAWRDEAPATAQVPYAVCRELSAAALRGDDRTLAQRVRWEVTLVVPPQDDARIDAVVRALGSAMAADITAVTHDAEMTWATIEVTEARSLA